MHKYPITRRELLYGAGLTTIATALACSRIPGLGSTTPEQLDASINRLKEGIYQNYQDLASDAWHLTSVELDITSETANQPKIEIVPAEEFKTHYIDFYKSRGYQESDLVSEDRILHDAVITYSPNRKTAYINQGAGIWQTVDDQTTGYTVENSKHNQALTSILIRGFIDAQTEYNFLLGYGLDVDENVLINGSEGFSLFASRTYPKNRAALNGFQAGTSYYLMRGIAKRYGFGMVTSDMLEFLIYLVSLPIENLGISEKELMRQMQRDNPVGFWDYLAAKNPEKRDDQKRIAWGLKVWLVVVTWWNDPDKTSAEAFSEMMALLPTPHNNERRGPEQNWSTKSSSPKRLDFYTGFIPHNNDHV